MQLAGGGDRLSAWQATASPDELDAAADALMSVVEGSWRVLWPHTDDVIFKDQHHITLYPGKVLSFRFFKEYPDRFVIVYIGDAPSD